MIDINFRSVLQFNRSFARNLLYGIGATNQWIATNRGEMVAEQFNLKAVKLDLSALHQCAQACALSTLHIP